MDKEMLRKRGNEDENGFSSHKHVIDVFMFIKIKPAIIKKNKESRGNPSL